MAIDNKDDEDYDLDLDGLDDLDGDDFDIEGITAGTPEDRNPVTRSINAGAKAIFNSTLGNDAVQDELINKALPTPFKSAYRKTGAIRGEIDKTLDHIEKEMRESKRDAKAAARAALPMIKPFLPAALTRKISDLSKDDERWNGGEIERDDAEISAALDSIFGAKQDPTTARREQQEEQLREAADMVAEEKKSAKQDSMLEHVINIDDGVKSVVRSHAAAIDYRRKMLELNYRQYFMQRDMLKANVEAYEKIIPALEAITKNTALPDYAKEEFGEITGALMKRNIIEKLSPMNWSRNYHKYIGIAARNKITELAANARNAFTMMQMGAGFGEGEDNADITREELRNNYLEQAATIAGGSLGSTLTENVLTPGAEKLRKFFLKHPTMVKMFASGSMALDNQAAFLNGIRNDPNANALLRGLTSAIDWLGVRGPDDMDHVDFETATVTSLSTAAKFTRKSVRTLEHVIPGALFKIDQSIRRIYDKSAALEMFDYERDRFVTVESWKKHVYATTANDSNTRSLDSSVNSLFYDLRRENSNAKDGLDRINDVSRDILKKAIELSNKHHCNIFDPRQVGGNETVPLGIDVNLWYALDTDEERTALTTALTGIFDAATTGMTETGKESHIAMIKMQINQRAQQHYGSQNGSAASRVRDLQSIYGFGVITSTDLVEGKKVTHKSRPDYYLGKVKVIVGEWVSKGVYYTSAGTLFNLRDVRGVIFGPNPNGKPEGTTSALVTPQQLQYLRTSTGEHYLNVENTLDFGDGTVYRVNRNLNGSSFLKNDFEGSTLGSELNHETETADYTGEGELEESLRRNKDEHKSKRKNRVSARKLKSESDFLRESSTIKIAKLSMNVDGVEKRLDNILTQLINTDYKEDLKQILEAIYAQQGAVTHTLSLDPRIRERIEAAKNRARSWGSRIAEGGRKAKDWTSNRYKSANEWLSKHDLTMNPFKLVGRVTASAYHAATDFGKAILGRRDILDALGNVVISALDIQSKRLYTLDEKNEYKLITEIRDIKGGIYRLSEDGSTYNEVFSPDAIAAKFSELCYSTNTGMRKVASDVGGWIGNRLRKLHERGKNITERMRNFGSMAVKSAWGAIAYIPDIYYSLDPEPREPRLLARVAKEDGYIDVKTGKPVRYFSDIHGEVRDLDGNVRISQADFENPTGKFIDTEGEDVTSLFTSITGTLGRIRKRTWNAAKGVYDSFRKAAEFTKELAAGFLSGVSGMFGKGGAVFGQRLVVQRLESIYMLLNDRMRGRGQGGPLPFEPMTDGAVPKAAANAAASAKATAKQAMSDIMDKPISSYLNGYKDKAQATYSRVKEGASKRLSNYTNKFTKEFTRHFGFDPNERYSEILGKLGKTRDSILGESGIDQTLLDIALLEGEFENLYRQYQRGEISKSDYQARLKDMALKSQYAKLYEQSMGYLGKKFKKAREEAAERVKSGTADIAGRAATQFDNAADRIKDSTGYDIRFWRSVVSDSDKNKKSLVEAFKDLTAKISTDKARARLKAVVLELRNLDINDPDWEEKYRALQAKKAELTDYLLSGKSSGFVGKGIVSMKNKLRSKLGNIRFTREGKVDSDGDGERDNSYASKLKKKSQAGFFKNFASAFGSVFKTTKDVGRDGKPGVLSKLFAPLTAVLAPLVGGLVTNLFTGVGGIMSMMKMLVTSMISGGASMLWGGAKMLGQGAMALARPVLSLAGGALGAAGGALAGLAVNPVTWAVVGTAAALYAGYKTYKWATADRLPKIDQLRVATYGAEDYSRLDLTDTQKTLFLEDAVKQYVRFNDSGVATIGKISGRDVLRMIQGWGIDPGDQQSVQVWMNWFQRRFLPVYTVWLTAAKQNLKIDSLADIGNEKSFSAKDRMALLKVTRLKSDSPIWTMSIGPYNDSKLLDFKTVDSIFADVESDWKALAERSASYRPDNATYLGGSQRYNTKLRFNEDGSVKEAEKGPEFELKDRKSTFSFNDRAGNSDELDGREVYNSKVYSTTGYMPKDNGYRQVKNSVDALTAVRLRLYGCWDLTTQNVNNAFALEDMVYPDLNYENEKLEYKGDVVKLFNEFKGLGGLPSGYTVESFKRWFANRFLPVLVAYVGAVNKELKADNPFNIPHNGGKSGFIIAKAMWAAKGDMLSSTPFKNADISYLSTAMDYLEASMATLEKVQAAYKLKEDSTKKAADKPAGATDEQNKILNATGGMYTVKDGKIVATTKGNEANTIAPWKAGNTANGGGGAPSSVWGKETSERDAMAGDEDPIKPPPPSPKREEAERLLIQAAVNAGITDPTEIAMLLAHAAHESGGFKFVEENLNYSSERLLQIFPRHFSPSDARKYGRNPKAIGNIAYGNRMGNRDPGDGYKYRGRGFMQLTGRNNYEALAKAYPQAKDPNWVSTPEGAAASAVYWWTSIARGTIRNLAKSGDVLGTTKIVNGGTNGIRDRRNRFAWYMDQIKSGNIKIEGIKKDTQKSEAIDENGLAGAQREDDAVTNSVDVMSKGAGVDTTPKADPTQPLTDAAKTAAKVPDRPTGTPEDIQANAVADAIQKTTPKAPASNAQRPNVPVTQPPAPATVDKESNIVKKVAERHALEEPVNTLIEIGRNQLSTLNAILQQLGGSTPAISAPINMRK